MTLTQYATYTTVASTTLTTTKSSSKVLVIAQFTAQSPTNAGDAFARLTMDGTPLDSGTLYWASVSALSPGTASGRATLSASTVVTVAAGAHTFAIEGAYYDGATAITVQAFARRINAVELG